MTISSGFWLMEHEVTQGEWAAAMGNNPSKFTACGASCPVERVSWDDAQDFAARLSARDGVTYRLPTEAEWEYAARGGQAYTYAGSDDLDAVGWYDDNSDGTTHPVCGKRRNGIGLCDMSGNVFEWVSDRYDAGYYAVSPPTDPQGPSASSGSDRVIRGGSWLHAPANVRVAYRGGDSPYDR